MSAGPSLDTLGIWGEAAALPEQLVEVLDWSRENVVIESLARYAIRSVVAVGLGVAATACEAIAALSAPDLALPLTVRRDAGLPAFVTATPSSSPSPPLPAAPRRTRRSAPPAPSARTC